MSLIKYSVILLLAVCSSAMQGQSSTKLEPPAQGDSVSLAAVANATTNTNVQITGYAPNYVGQEMQVITYADYVSGLTIPVVSQQVNDSGLFRFNIYTAATKRVLFKCMKQSGAMYVQPGGNYRVFFPARDTVRFANPETDESVDLTIGSPDSLDINNLILDFNARFDEFWKENYQYFVVKKARLKLDTFGIETEQHYSKVANAYFQDFLIYSVAGLKLNTMGSKKELAARYLINHPVRFGQYEYMTFFNSYFNHYIAQFAATKDGAAFKNALNTAGDYQYCMDQLKADKVLQNDTLRELAFIKGLQECYYSADFNRKTVNAILEYIAINGTIPANKEIAANVLRTFSKLQPLAPAPDFLLPDRANKLKSLASFKGKYIYLNFWTTNCTPCLQELKLIGSLRRKYGDRVVFVSINTETDTLQASKFLKSMPKYDWVFLHQRPGLENPKEAYEIRNFPAYFLIDPNGRFYQCPALSPAESIEATFSEIVRRSQRKRGDPPPMRR